MISQSMYLYFILFPKKYSNGIRYELFFLNLVCNYVRNKTLKIILFDAQFYRFIKFVSLDLVMF